MRGGNLHSAVFALRCGSLTALPWQAVFLPDVSSIYNMLHLCLKTPEVTGTVALLLQVLELQSKASKAEFRIDWALCTHLEAFVLINMLETKLLGKGIYRKGEFLQCASGGLHRSGVARTAKNQSC